MAHVSYSQGYESEYHSKVVLGRIYGYIAVTCVAIVKRSRQRLTASMPEE